MENIIIYSSKNLLSKVRESYSNSAWSIESINSEIILRKCNDWIKLEIVEEKDLHDEESMPRLNVNELNIYAIHYKSIKLIKDFLIELNELKSWINNDFDPINYPYANFIKMIHENKDWDWRK